MESILLILTEFELKRATDYKKIIKSIFLNKSKSYLGYELILENKKNKKTTKFTAKDML